ncbi:MerC domain-containing protein [Fulvivirga sediminis]|uniref:MerC domain-containing protein n=1 Tax=Fulvivirga sediminis TaxID=2803949 RepID=A0A937FEB9_9BACT|nr:MerC domain-containing protein [Fulvivirga sediminis]MBL3658833.1 MerC domain-containing protein [Fulvivirga sediminis]
MRNSFVGVHWDFLGFAASFLCAIHCMALPVILSLSSWVGWQVMHDPVIEFSIFVISVLIAAHALRHGYKRHHKSFKPMIMALGGFALILFGHILFHHYEGITILGAITVSIAHALNWYLERSASNNYSANSKHNQPIINDKS